MSHRTLLIIDDDKAWSYWTAAFFENFGYKVVTAVTCAEGYELAQRYNPACILLDYQLPDEEGNVCAAWIRGNSELKKIPIIMVSGNDSQELRAYVEYELDGFLSKDATLPHIKAVVEGLLRRVNWDRDIVMHSDVRLEGASLQVFRDSKLVKQLSVEQFKLFTLLLEKSPSFVSEDELFRQLYAKQEPSEEDVRVRGVAQRLRENLGPQLGRRIKFKSGLGWIYLQPRVRTQ